MNYLKKSVFGLLCFFIAVVFADEAKFNDVKIKTIKVGDSIYMLMGGNIGISTGEDGVFLIDDQFAPLTEKIKAAITEISAKPIRFIINIVFFKTANVIHMGDTFFVGANYVYSPL